MAEQPPLDFCEVRPWGGWCDQLDKLFRDGGFNVGVFGESLVLAEFSLEGGIRNLVVVDFLAQQRQ